MLRPTTLAFTLVLFATLAHADDPRDIKDQKSPKARAEQLANDAQTSHDPAVAVACGQAYLDLYNANPRDSDDDKILFNAGTCFELGASIGAAVQAFELVGKYYPMSALAGKSLARLARLYARIGHYEEAAGRLEGYVAKYAGEKDAPDALRDAIRFRLGFGPDDKAIADAKLFVRIYGAKQPAAAGEVMLALAPLYERTGGAAEAAYLQQLLKDFGAKDTGLAVVAEAKLGEALWHRACPGKEVDGLCLKVARAPRAAVKVKTKLSAKDKPKQCGPESRTKITVVARDAALAKQAHDAFARVDQLSRGTLTPDVLYRAARAKKLAADADLEAYLAIGFPKQLDFASDKAARKQDSLKRFNEFIASRTKLGALATQKYEAIIAMKDVTNSIAAAARLGQISEAFADTLFTAELPADIATGPYADDKIDAFCDKMAEVAEPLEKRAIEAFSMCMVKATQLGIETDDTRLCERELAMLAPDDPAASTDDVYPEFPAPMALALEGPPFVASPSPPYAAAMAKYVAADKAGFTNATCRDTSAAFIGAGHKAGPDALFMAALSLHRCGIDGAQSVYASVVAGQPPFARASSNLAEIQFRSGQRDVAQKAWEAAIAADPKLYGAHVGLAAIETDAYRRLDPAARKTSPLRASIRNHLESAMAVAPDRAAAYIQLGIFEAEHPAAAAFDLHEGRAAPIFQPAAKLALGLELARQGRVMEARTLIGEAVAIDPRPDARLAMALADLHLRRYADALDEAGKLPPSYTQLVALGLAQRGTGKLDLAIATYDKASALDAKRGEAPFDQAIAFERRAAGMKSLADQRTELMRAKDAYARAAAVKDVAIATEAKGRVDLTTRVLVQLDAAIASGIK